MRALITGVTGFMGSHLAERLLAEGIAVRGLARRPADAAFLAQQGAEIVQADLAERAGLERAVRDCQVVLHTAAWTGGPGLDEQQAWTINVAATGWLLQAAASAGAQRFIYFSSVAVYGLNAAPLIDESAPTPPVGQLYPDSKIAAETLVRAAQTDGLPTTIIRPASTYGPRGSAWTIGPVEQIKAGRLVLLGEDRGLVNTGYIDNLVEGVLLALHSPAAAGETFNLCDGTAITYREYYQRYAAMLGRERLPVYPAWLARGAVSPPGRWLRRLLGRPVPGPWSYHFRFNPSRFSIAKAQRLLGYAPAIDLDEGMRRTEQWLRAQGYLA
ncbi:MAG TPA: NAD(P)-dependent oxidoreductase [Anaerolineae bacterium]|nr:NAD(P)-dependent oxidoreductase [Anaerolineae bacterium]HNU05548.1 NAD(P)-dependent oxidoreductase [Anaerolineae bacterium]